MYDPHPNLGQPLLGIRKIAYFSAAAAAAFIIGGALLLVNLGIIPPSPTDVYASVIILIILFVPFFAFVDNPGEKRTKIEKMSEFAFIWLFISGVTQTVWELPWFVLDLTGMIHGITEEDTWAWMWWAYGGADTRYITSNPTIAGVEFMAGFAGPFELYGWYLYVYGDTRAKKIAGCWWALLLGLGLTWATGIFFVAEWHVGWENIQQGAMGFWLKFVGLNLPWLIAPIVTIPAAIYELAHLYRQEGYELAMQDESIKA